MGEGIVTVLILLPIRTATRLADNTLALAMGVRHFAQVGLSELLAGPRLRADHGQTGRNWITSCLPTTPTLIPRVWIAGSNQPGVECPLAFSSALVSILRRACTANPAEHPRKVLLRFETAGHGDIQDTCLRRAQHLLRTLYSVA